MDFKTYQQEASRTYPDLGSLKLNVVHMIMGMVSELEEFDTAVKKRDIVNVSEELADQHWYLANYCRHHTISYDVLAQLCAMNTFYGNINEIFIELTNGISALTDLEKKYLAYNKPVDHQLRIRYCRRIFRALNAAYKRFDINIQQSLTNNIAKLKVRFPEKFDQDLAINRNVEKERVELEK